MSFTYKELKHKTVAQLKEIAKDIQHDALQGYTQLNKDHLIEALCTALDIPKHEHHDVVGVDKSKIKRQIKELKGQRQKAIEAKNKADLRAVRKQIKSLKRTLRKAMV